jgi:hypothetical protein
LPRGNLSVEEFCCLDVDRYGEFSIPRVNVGFAVLVVIEEEKLDDDPVEHGDDRHIIARSFLR